MWVKLVNPSQSGLPSEGPQAPPFLVVENFHRPIHDTAERSFIHTGSQGHQGGRHGDTGQGERTANTMARGFLGSSSESTKKAGINSNL